MFKTFSDQSQNYTWKPSKLIFDHDETLTYNIGGPIFKPKTQSIILFRDAQLLMKMDMSARFQLLLGKRVNVQFGITANESTKQHMFQFLKEIGFYNYNQSLKCIENDEYLQSFLKWQLEEMKPFVKKAHNFSILTPTTYNWGMRETLLLKAYLKDPSKILKDVDVPTGKNIFLGARLDTPGFVFGVATICVSHHSKYGLYETANPDEYIICEEKTIVNLSYQGQTQERGVFKLVKPISVNDLIGEEVSSCLFNTKITVATKYPYEIVASSCLDFTDRELKMKEFIQSCSGKPVTLYPTGTDVYMKQVHPLIQYVFHNYESSKLEKEPIEECGLVVIQLDGSVQSTLLSCKFKEQLNLEKINFQYKPISLLVANQLVSLGLAIIYCLSGDNIVERGNHYQLECTGQLYKRNMLSRARKIKLIGHSSNLLEKFIGDITFVDFSKTKDLSDFVNCPQNSSLHQTILSTVPILKESGIDATKLDYRAWRYILGFNDFTQYPVLESVKKKLSTDIQLDEYHSFHFLDIASILIQQSLVMESIKPMKSATITHSRPSRRMYKRASDFLNRFNDQPLKDKVRISSIARQHYYREGCKIYHNLFQVMDHIIKRQHNSLHFDERSQDNILDIVYLIKLQNNVEMTKSFYLELNFNSAFESAIANFNNLHHYFKEVGNMGMKPSKKLSVIYLESMISTLSPIIPFICEYFCKQYYGDEKSTVDLSWPEFDAPNQEQQEQFCAYTIIKKMSKLVRHNINSSNKKVTNIEILLIDKQNHPIYQKAREILEKYHSDIQQNSKRALKLIARELPLSPSKQFLMSILSTMIQSSKSQTIPPDTCTILKEHTFLLRALSNIPPECTLSIQLSTSLNQQLVKIPCNF